MYQDTVTLFNRRTDRSTQTVTWYATVLKGVNLNNDRGAIVRQYGEQSQDNVILNVKLEDGQVNGKPYLQSKEWQRGADPEGTITVKSGEDADFFWAGEWTGSNVIPNDGYGLVGFRDYMERNYDNVFEVTSVGEYSVIPHLQITGK